MLLGIIFLDIVCRSFRDFEYREISCLKIWDFWEKFHSDLKSEVLDISGSKKVDQANFLLGTWGYRLWAHQGCSPQPKYQSLYRKKLLLAVKVVGTIELLRSQLVLLHLTIFLVALQNRNRIFSVIFYR